MVVEDEGPRDGTSSLLDQRVEDFGCRRRPRARSLRCGDALRHLRSGADGRWAAPDSLSPEVSSSQRGSTTSFPTWRPISTASTSRGRRGRSWRPRPAASTRGRRCWRPTCPWPSTRLREPACERWRSREWRWRLRPTETSRSAGRATSTCSWPRRTCERAHACSVRCGMGAGARLSAARAVLGLAPLRPNRQRATCSAATDSDIDLHWHLVPTRGTFPDFDTLWDAPRDGVGRRPSDPHPVAVRRLGPLGRSRRQGRVALDAQPARRARACMPSATPGSAPTGRSEATS